MTMRTVDEYQKMKEEEQERLREQGLRYNIKCPKCVEGELFWKDRLVLLSNPPQVTVECNECGTKVTIFK
jgi:DNA-directed RNA polymerase subunit M/transcription elongation factor TFIIS